MRVFLVFTVLFLLATTYAAKKKSLRKVLKKVDMQYNSCLYDLDKLRGITKQTGPALVRKSNEGVLIDWKRNVRKTKILLKETEEKLKKCRNKKRRLQRKIKMEIKG